ncbi:MAG: hypothetical protein Q8761_03070, partial [Sweet potato little leaf phytoplasma]|nr:hypothetical protein [Sweet potato little leaf phytoplasma]
TLTAFNKIAANKGAGTPGIDNKTIDGINLERCMWLCMDSLFFLFFFGWMWLPKSSRFFLGSYGMWLSLGFFFFFLWLIPLPPSRFFVVKRGIKSLKPFLFLGNKLLFYNFEIHAKMGLYSK